MKTKTFLIAFILMMLAIIGTFAWFVSFDPQDAGKQTGIHTDAAKMLPKPAGDSQMHPASRTPDASQRTAPDRTIVRSISADEDEVFRTALSNGDLPRMEQTQAIQPAEPKPTALSKHVAYGAEKTGEAQPRMAEASGRQEPTALPSEILDNSPVAVPMALLNPAPSTISSPEQAAALDKLREGFANAVGGPKQDPASKAYRDNWKAAQPSADQRYRQWFGDQAYSAQQRAQYLELHPAAR